MNSDDEQLFEVESIVDSRTTKSGVVEYRVRWANYSPSNDTWEPASNLEMCHDFIEVYEKRKSITDNKESHKKRDAASNRSRSNRHHGKTNDKFTVISSEGEQPIFLLIYCKHSNFVHNN